MASFWRESGAKHSPLEIRPEGPFGQFRRFQRKSGRFWKIWLLKSRLLNGPLGMLEDII